MKKKLKNDFEQMCDTLEKKRNYIEDARKEVNDYIAKDYNKYLKLKAETEDMSYMDYMNSLLAIGAFVISVLSIFYNDVVAKAEELVEATQGALWATMVNYSCSIIMIIIIAVAGVYPLLKTLRFRTVGKWRKYIKAILDDMKEKAEGWKK